MAQVCDTKHNNGRTVSLRLCGGECILVRRKNSEEDPRVFYININGCVDVDFDLE